MASEAPNHGGTAVVVVEFSLTNPEYPFVGLSAAESCWVSLERMLPRGEGVYAEFFSVIGADPDRVLELARAKDLVEPTLIAEYDDGGLFEFTVEGFCPAQSLAEQGAIPRTVESEDGRGTIIVEIPAGQAVTEIIEAFLADHPSAELVAKRSTDRLTPLFSQEELQHALGERLTPRQREVLTTAYELGYYEPGGGATGADISDELDISPPTVSQHLQAAERKLVSILLETDLHGGRPSSA
ncbi:MAG: helix-turn-helix domain-containing protein [Halobacteriales archaeon]|nr:helix-turn-helix domain-containing protein [Halobacteriales archaeon]